MGEHMKYFVYRLTGSISSSHFCFADIAALLFIPRITFKIEAWDQRRIKIL
jgi:hypothetical protein